MEISRRELLIAALSAGVVPFASRAAFALGNETPEILRKIAFLGASVTDGFTLPGKVNAMITLADVVKATLKADVKKPFRRSSSFLFRDPELFLRKYVDATLNYQPSLLIGVDLMFWFGYGFGLAETRRLELCDRGLAMLSEFKCPLVVGDYPDMSQAVKGKGFLGSPMIIGAHVPKPDTLVELNRRLREFATKRGKTVVLPLATFVERIKKNQPFEALDSRWDGDLMHTLLDQDLLHTSLDGEIALSLLIAESLAKSDLGIPRDAFVGDKEKVKKRLLDAHAAEIAQRQRK